MQAKSYGFRRQTKTPQQLQQQQQQQQQPNNTGGNIPPKNTSQLQSVPLAPLPNNTPHPPQFFSYPPVPPVPIEPTPDMDLFSFFNLYQPIIAASVYSESAIDFEHSLSKALLSDIPGPEIEPELYPDTTNTGVIHPARVKLTQKVMINPLDKPNHTNMVMNQPNSTQTSGQIDLISNELDRGIERSQLFQPMSHSLRNKTKFIHQGAPIHNNNLVKSKARPYIASNPYQDDIPAQHVAKRQAK